MLRYRGDIVPLGAGVAGLGASLQRGTMTTADQEQVSSCLLARVNAAGQHVDLDLIGYYPGFRRPSVPATFKVREAAYFGNLFADPVRAYVWLPGMVAVRGCSPRGDCGVLQPTGVMAAHVYGSRGDIDPKSECYVARGANRGTRPVARLRWGTHNWVPFRYCVIGSNGTRYAHVMTVLLKDRMAAPHLR